MTDIKNTSVIDFEDISDDQMNQMIDGTLTEFDEGDLVNGTVVKIEHDEVLVDIGFKSEGVVPVRELSIRKDADPSEIVNLGEYWNADGIRRHRTEIIDTGERTGRLFARTYRYLAAAHIWFADDAEAASVLEAPAQPGTADVRAWAREQGLTVSDRGRIPAEVLRAFHEAHRR